MTKDQKHDRKMKKRHKQTIHKTAIKWTLYLQKICSNPPTFIREMKIKPTLNLHTFSYLLDWGKLNSRQHLLLARLWSNKHSHTLADRNANWYDHS